MSEQLVICIPKDVARTALEAVRNEMMGFERELVDIDAIEYFDKLLKGGAILLNAIENDDRKAGEL